MADLHHLHVVKFDKSLSENQVTCKTAQNTSKKVPNYEKKTDPIEVDKKLSDVLTKLPNKSENFRNTKNVNFSPKNKPLKTSRNNNLKRSLSSRTWSFDDIREKVKNYVCGAKIRPNVHRRKFENNLNKKRSSVLFKSHHKSQDDIKVLYTSERSNSQKNKRDCSTKVPYVNNSTHRNSRTNNGIFRNTYLTYHTCRKTGLFPIPKRKKHKSCSKTNQLHIVSPLQYENTTSHKSNKQHSDCCYSLVNFPMSKNKCQQNEQNNDLSLHAVGSELLTAQCKGSNILNVSQVVLPSAVPTVCPAIRKVPSPCCTEALNQEDPIRDFFFFLRTVLKYFLLILTIVVWTPCIIIGTISWFMISLMNPEEEDLNKQQDLKCIKPAKCKKTFNQLIQCILFQTKRFALKIRDLMCTENDTTTRRSHCHSLTPEMSYRVTGIRRRNRTRLNANWQPNPNKKYVLYFSSHRGWLMKPVRNTPCGKSKIFSFQASQEGCMRKQSKKDRTVTFWDAQDPCVCEHVNNGAKIGKNTQMKWKSSQTLEEIITKQPSQVSFKPIACPIARSCPGETRKLLRMEEVKEKGNITKLASTHSIHDNIQTGPKSAIAAAPKIVPSKRVSAAKKKEDLKLEVKKNKKEKKEKEKKEKPYRKSNKDDESVGAKITNCGSDMMRSINAADSVWGDGVECGNMYLSAMKRRPCFWIYKRCPELYPCFLVWHKLWRSCCQGCIFIFASCVWCPLFFCCYLCYMVICSSCGGGGCEC